MDEFGQEISPEMMPQEAGWVIEPAEDGHTHEVEDYEIKSPYAKDKEEKVVADVLELVSAANEWDSENIEAGREAEGFYDGTKQWATADKTYLNEAQRACLTINKIQPELDTLFGYQRQQRTDLAYLPFESGDQMVSDVLNFVSKHITEQCYFEREDSKVFEDAAITGRGIYNLYVDRTQNLEGEIKIEAYDWDGVLLGEHSKEDLSDCEFLIKHKMVSLAKAKQLYPKKAKELETAFDMFFLDDPKKVRHGGKEWSNKYVVHTDDSRRAVSAQTSGGVTLVDVARKELRMIECWRKVYVNSSVLIHQGDDFYFNAFGWRSEDIDAVAALDGFFSVEAPVQKIRISKLCGTTLLSDENPADLPTNDFHVVPVYYKKRGDKWWGKVEAVKDSQRELNKRRSQLIDIGDRMTNYGWFFDESTFPDPATENQFKRNSSKPGFAQRVSSVERPPFKVDGANFPVGLAQMAELAATDIAESLNIKAVPMGANDSGSKLQQLQQMRLLGNEGFTDNHSFAKRKLGRLLAAMIQRYWTPERIYRLLKNQNAKEKEGITLGGKSFMEIPEREIIEVLRTTDLTRYDVVVSETSWSPSAMMQVGASLETLAQAGVQVPFKIHLQTWNIPEVTKQQMLEDYEASQQEQATQSDAAYEAEVEKTLIAKGHIPQAVAEKYGIPQTSPAPVQADQGTLAG